MKMREKQKTDCFSGCLGACFAFFKQFARGNRDFLWVIQREYTRQSFEVVGYGF